MRPTLRPRDLTDANIPFAPSALGAARPSFGRAPPAETAGVLARAVAGANRLLDERLSAGRP